MDRVSRAPCEAYDPGVPTDAVIRQFQLLNPKVRPHAMVVFLNDPFDTWDMAFIAELWFHDRTVAIRLQKKTPLTAAQLARADYIFDWRGGRLVAAGGAATGFAITASVNSAVEALPPTSPVRCRPSA